MHHTQFRLLLVGKKDERGGGGREEEHSYLNPSLKICARAPLEWMRVVESIKQNTFLAEEIRTKEMTSLIKGTVIIRQSKTKKYFRLLQQRLMV